MTTSAAAGATPTAIDARGLSKRYGATQAVADLDLRVETGQVFGFLGPNGAGKTTTIRMLMALQRPTSGRATVLGMDAWQDAVALHRHVGYLPGELALHPRLTGDEHLAWFARARGLRDRTHLHELVERFGAVTDRPARELSTGNRQKIGLVLAFMHRPRLLVLDEPTAGLDPLVRNEFEHLARETVADGRTVFLSSHDLDEVQHVADRVAIIRGGTVVATDSVEGLRRATPQRMEVRFRQPVDPARFAAMPGVVATAGHDGEDGDGTHLSLQVTGDVGPVLRAVADCDPVDVVARHADLDELFLDFYREGTRR